MSRVIKAGQIKTPTPSSAYLGYWPCLQAATDTNVADLSGNSNNLSKSGTATWNNNGSTGVWSTANYASSHENAAAVCPQAANAVLSGFDYAAGDSLILAMFVNGTRPSVASRWFGNTSGSTGQPGFTSVVSNSSGICDIRFASASGSETTATCAGTLFAASPVEAHFVIAIDGQTRKVYAYKNGVVDSNVNGVSILAGAAVDLRHPTNNFGFGGTTSAGVSAGFRDIHLLLRKGKGLPTNMASIALRLAKSRWFPLSSNECSA